MDQLLPRLRIDGTPLSSRAGVNVWVQVKCHSICLQRYNAGDLTRFGVPWSLRMPVDRDNFNLEAVRLSLRYILQTPALKGSQLTALHSSGIGGVSLDAFSPHTDYPAIPPFPARHW
jgi:hypothetical protein